MHTRALHRAEVEDLGRLVSLVLRMPSPFTPPQPRELNRLLRNFVELVQAGRPDLGKTG